MLCTAYSNMPHCGDRTSLYKKYRRPDSAPCRLHICIYQLIFFRFLVIISLRQCNLLFFCQRLFNQPYNLSLHNILPGFPKSDALMNKPASIGQLLLQPCSGSLNCNIIRLLFGILLLAYFFFSKYGCFKINGQLKCFPLKQAVLPGMLLCVPVRGFLRPADNQLMPFAD